MTKTKLLGWIAFAAIAAAVPAGAAEKIELPPEELAKESVLPVFEGKSVVRNRNVVTDGRMDVNFMYGLALSEAIHNVSRFGLSGYYHTSEDHAFGVMYAKNSGGLSSYAHQLRDQYKLDFTRAPAPESVLMGDWNWKMFYGKMSIAKDTAFNLSLYTTLAGGFVQYSHKSYPALAPGLGQKFYFGKSFALRFDMRLFMHQAPIPFLQNRIHENHQIPTADEFNERLTFTTVLDVGLSWLF